MKFRSARHHSYVEKDVSAVDNVLSYPSLKETADSYPISGEILDQEPR